MCNAGEFLPGENRKILSWNDFDRDFDMVGFSPEGFLSDRDCAWTPVYTVLSSVRATDNNRHSAPADALHHFIF
jgi:hypothetical protein